MKTFRSLFCLVACVLEILSAGCASPSRTATAQYRDAFGNPVVITPFLSIHAPGGAIRFAFPEGWFVYSQPTESKSSGYVFNRAVGGLNPPLLCVAVREDPQSRPSASPDEIIQAELRRELKPGHPDAGWQSIAEAVTAEGRQVPIYLAIGFPSGGRLTAVIPENGFSVRAYLESAQSGFDRMMSYQRSLEEIISSCQFVPQSSDNAMEPTASRTIHLHMSSIPQSVATRALARGGSSCSR
jgi:hypothetical protein